MKWRRVDSAPPLTPTRGLNPGEYPALAAAATRKEGDHCVIRATHDSLADLPNNLDFCSTLLNGGGRYTGFQNIFSNALFDVGQSLSPAFPGINVGFLESSAIPHFIFGNRIFNHRGIEWGGDYTQQGATTNWPTSTRTTRTTICGTNPSVSAVGRAEGQNVIISCPTQWRRLSEAPNLQTFPYSPRDGNSGTQTAAGDYCILSQSAAATDETTARRCDTVFGDVAGGIQRIIDDAVESHGFINPALSAPYPVDLTNTGIYWLHGTDIYSPYGVKLQGGTNVDYVLSAEQGGFTGGDCANNSYIRQGFVSGIGLYQTCSIRVGYATTPPPLGETANPPASTGDLSNCDLRQTANVPARPERSCSAIFGDYGSSFSNIVAIAEARRTQINTLTGGDIPVLGRGAGTASHRFYIVRTGGARGMYTRNGVPVMDNLYLTSPLGQWTAESCTAAGYTLGGRISNGNLYQTCSVGGGFATSRPAADASSSFNFQGHGSVFASCVIARTPGATLGTNEHLCSTLLGAPNLGNFANFEEIVNALEARRLETNLVRPGQASDAARYNPAGYQSDGGLLYQHPLVIVQTGANAGIYVGTGIKADKQSAYVAQQPGFTIADCAAAGWSVRVTGGYVQCEMEYLYVNNPPPLTDSPSGLPTQGTGGATGAADCTITATRGSAITDSRRCNNVLNGLTGFQDAITKFNARRDEYNGVFDPDIPAFDFDSVVYVVRSGAGAGVYTQHGLRATDTRLFEAVTDGFTPEDCTASGHRLAVTADGGNNFVSCQMLIWTVPNKPPLANPANPPASSEATSIATNCGITQTPGANPADGSPRCASLLGANANSFSQMVARFAARRTQYNNFHDTDIPSGYVPWAPGPNNPDSVIYRVASGADAGLYTQYGLPSSDDPLPIPQLFDPNIDRADCEAAGYNRRVRTSGGVQREECTVFLYAPNAAERAPELDTTPTAESQPTTTGSQINHCVLGAYPVDGNLGTGVKCSDIVSAASGITDLAGIKTQYNARRTELNNIIDDHNPANVRFAEFSVNQRLYVYGGKLYSENGIEIRSAAYGAGDRSDQGGFTAADCTASGYTQSTLTSAQTTRHGVVWPGSFCQVKHVNRVTGFDNPLRVAIQNAKHTPADADIQSGCNVGLPVSNIPSDPNWDRNRCLRLFGGGGTSFSGVLGQIRALTGPTNAVEGTTIPATGPNAHGPADPIFVIWVRTAIPTEIQSIYGVQVRGIRSAPTPDEDNSLLTDPLERFSRQDCVNAGWTVGGTGSPSAGDLQEFCNILWRRRTTTAPTPPTTPPEEQSAAAAESSLGAFGFQDELDSGGGATYPKLLAAPAFSASSPLAEDEIAPQVHEGEQHKHCITRHAKDAETPPPSDMQCGNVFAQHGGFPDLAMIKKAAASLTLTFDPTTDALSIDESGKVLLVKEDESGKMIEVPIPKPLGASPATPASSGGGGGGGGGAAIGIGVGSAAILGLLAYSLQSGAVGAGAGLGEFNWSPDISFAYNNTGMREIRYGTRMDFRHTDWHIWWTASQINSSGETKKMRYGSGAQYSADWWSARYNNSIHDKEARADVALKATGEFRDWGGVWKFSPTYRANVEVDEYNVQTWSHRVNLEAVWRINKWTLTQSTGFTAKKASDIGETLQTRLKLTREF